MSDDVTREAIIAAAEQAVAADSGERPGAVLQPEVAVQESAADEQPAEPAAESSAEPTPTESKLGAIIRAKRDAQRIRLDAQREREAVAKERADLAALKARLQSDPVATLKEFGITLDDVTRHVVNEGTPEAEIAKLRREVEAERSARSAWQESLAQRERQAAEAAFVGVASKHPTLSALYGDEPQELLARAYAVQEAYHAKTGMIPTREEIAEYLEEVESRRYSKFVSKQAATPPPVKPAPRAPAKVSAPKDFDHMSPAEQRRHLIAIAQHAEKSYRSQQ